MPRLKVSIGVAILLFIIAITHIPAARWAHRISKAAGDVREEHVRFVLAVS